MKRTVLMFSVLLMLSCSGLASAKDVSYKNLIEVAHWSTLPSAASISLERLPYKNILEASKWSRMINGRTLTASLRKKTAHASRVDDYDSDELFAVGSGGRGGAGCNWGCCMRNCMAEYPNQLCAINCGACYFGGGPWPCAMCLSCGAVGIVMIEVCSLHCCQSAGGC
jgi:hypothetical protein